MHACPATAFALSPQTQHLQDTVKRDMTALVQLSSLDVGSAHWVQQLGFQDASLWQQLACARAQNMSRVGVQAARSVHVLYLAQCRAAPGWAQCAVYHLHSALGRCVHFLLIAGYTALSKQGSKTTVPATPCVRHVQWILNSS